MKKNNNMLAFAGIGFELLALVLGALFVGKGLDEQMGTNGVWTAGLLLVCLSSWTFHFVILLKRFQAQVDAESEEDQDEKR